MRISFHAKKISNWMKDLPVGGAWGRSLQQGSQKNLGWLWSDGLFASASDNIILNFISLYVLVLGGTQVQVGLMSSLSSFTSAIMLFLGAILAERIGRHKDITVASGGIMGRLAILLMVFVPIFVHDSRAVWIVIILSVMRDGFNNLAFPSWMSVINETVPIEGRGRYFGARNFIMSISSMAGTLLAGKLITLFVAETGYQIAIGLAFILGLGSLISFWNIKTQPRIRQSLPHTRLSLKSISDLIKKQPQFIALIVTAVVWNFGINVTGPFFNPYMAQNLKFSASTIGLMAVITSLAGFLTLNRIGSFSDRFGPRKVQLVSMILIPLLPVAWIFASQPWHVGLINALGGVMWAAFNLCSFNFMLNSIPMNQVSRYSALYQIMVTLSLAFGALLGSALLSRYGFTLLLVVTTVFRILAVLLFVRLIHEPVKKADEVTL